MFIFRMVSHIYTYCVYSSGPQPFLAPGTGFVEDNFSTDLDVGGDRKRSSGGNVSGVHGWGKGRLGTPGLQGYNSLQDFLQTLYITRILLECFITSFKILRLNLKL